MPTPRALCLVAALGLLALPARAQFPPVDEPDPAPPRPAAPPAQQPPEDEALSDIDVLFARGAYPQALERADALLERGAGTRVLLRAGQCRVRLGQDLERGVEYLERAITDLQGALRCEAWLDAAAGNEALRRAAPAAAHHLRVVSSPDARPEQVRASLEGLHRLDRVEDAARALERREQAAGHPDHGLRDLLNRLRRTLARAQVERLDEPWSEVAPGVQQVASCRGGLRAEWAVPDGRRARVWIGFRDFERGHVEVHDEEGRRRVARLRFPSEVQRVAARGEDVFVATRDRLYRLDAATFEVRAELRLGVLTLVPSPTRPVLYALDGAARLHVLDAATLASRWSSGEPVGHRLGIDPRGDVLYVLTSQPWGGSVLSRLVVTGDAFELDGQVASDGRYTCDVEVSADGALLYSGDFVTGRPGVLASVASDLATVVGPLEKGAHSHSLRFHPCEPWAVAFDDDAQVLLIDAPRHRILQAIALPAGVRTHSGCALAFSAGGDAVYFMHGEGVLLVPLPLLGEERRRVRGKLLARARAGDAVREAGARAATDPAGAVARLREVVAADPDGPAALDAAARVFELDPALRDVPLAEPTQALPAEDLATPPAREQALALLRARPPCRRFLFPSGPDDAVGALLERVLGLAEGERERARVLALAAEGALREAPEEPRRLLSHGLALAAAGRPGLAAPALTRVVELDAWQTEASVLATHELCAIHREGGRPDAADALSLLLFERQPDDWNNARRAADVARARGQPHRAALAHLVSLEDFPARDDTLRALAELGHALERAAAPADPLRVDQVVAAADPAVALLRTPEGGVGTGFAISRIGLVLTCAHVVDDGLTVEATVRVRGGPLERRTFDTLRILRIDEARDLALLRVVAAPEVEFAPLAVTPDAVPLRGEEVVVIGNPGLGDQVLERTVTTGVVSEPQRRLGDHALVQFTAAVNPGNSGGPLLDRRGRVLGVVISRAGLEGVGFAVPAPTLWKFLQGE